MGVLEYYVWLLCISAENLVVLMPSFCTIFNVVGTVQWLLFYYWFLKVGPHAPHNVPLCFIIHDLSMEVQYFYLRMITTVLITGQVKFLCVGHQNC